MKEKIIENMKAKVLSVLEGKEESERLIGVFPLDVRNYIEELGGEEDSDRFETNGWQWDFWQYFKYKGNTYCFGGSGYYGGGTFSRAN